MAKSKYIIFVNAAMMELPVIFNPIIDHCVVKLDGFKPISAGFCSLNKLEENISYSIWGESISLKLKSRPEDREILNKYLEYNC